MLPKVTEKLSTMNASKQKAHLVTKLYNILEGRGKLQTAAEMCNLASNHRAADESFAEFFTTFVPWHLNCHELLNRLESLKEEGNTMRHMQFKKRARDSETVFFNIAEIYGCRPADESLLYLSPFEFTMWWDVCSLEAPPFPEDIARSKLPKNRLTRWCISSDELTRLRSDIAFKPIAGEHYDVDDDFIRNTWDVPDRSRYRTFPRDDAIPGLRRLRSQFFLRRRLREVVPAPQGY